jgi:hypothetical protein
LIWIASLAAAMTESGKTYDGWDFSPRKSSERGTKHNCRREAALGTAAIQIQEPQPFPWIASLPPETEKPQLC